MVLPNISIPWIDYVKFVLKNKINDDDLKSFLQGNVADPQDLIDKLKWAMDWTDGMLNTDIKDMIRQVIWLKEKLQSYDPNAYIYLDSVLSQ